MPKAETFSSPLLCPFTVHNESGQINRVEEILLGNALAYTLFPVVGAMRFGPLPVLVIHT